MFSKDTYISRRKSLKAKVQQGILFFPGNPESSMNYKDNWYPFRQDSTFLYYTGINNISNIFFLIDVDNDQEILFGNDPTPEEVVWTGAMKPLAQFAEKAGITQVRPLKKLWEFIKTKKQKGQKIHYLPPYRAETQIHIADLLETPLNQVEDNKSTIFIKAVVEQRSIKTPEEITELEKAVNLTAEMHRHALRNAVPGRSEKEIAGELQAIAIGGGGNISFPIILTKNGQYLHNHPTQDIIEEGDLILCDCGAETTMNYAGDMTRTFPAGKNFSPLQKEVYNIVLHAHNTAIAALKPGIQFKDVHLLACRQLVQGLKNLGLMKGEVNEAVEEGAHTLFFQCGLGHQMGMDVHDMENFGESFVGYDRQVRKSTKFGLKSLRLGKALEPGYVLTVEPGIYFNPFLIDSWEAQKKFIEFVNYDEVKKYKEFGGIRIEEDLLITNSGSRLLGDPLAKEAGDIEKMRNS